MITAAAVYLSTLLDSFSSIFFFFAARRKGKKNGPVDVYRKKKTVCCKSVFNDRVLFFILNIFYPPVTRTFFSPTKLEKRAYGSLIIEIYSNTLFVF